MAYYAIAKMQGGGVLFLVMSKPECVEHGKKHSKVYDKKAGKFMPGTPWVDDEDSMCKKTVLLQLTKNLPLSIETQKALSIDETSREYRPGIVNALDLPDTTNWDEPPTEAIPDKGNPPPAGSLKGPGIEAPTATTSQSKPKHSRHNRSAAQEDRRRELFVILGSMGYEKVSEITQIKDANKLIAEIDKAYADRQK